MQAGANSVNGTTGTIYGASEITNAGPGSTLVQPNTNISGTNQGGSWRMMSSNNNNSGNSNCIGLWLRVS
jgi:hypothetical protein